MGLKLTNNAVSRLASSILAGDVSLSVTPGTGALFPTLSVGDYFPATIIRASDNAYEIVKVTARSTDVLTITRAQEGTAALAFAANDRIELRDTAKTKTDQFVENATHAATSKATPVDADEIPLVDSEASNGLKKLTIANLKALIFSAWGALVAAGTSKATPVDADSIAIADSAASNATKQLTISNLKAFVFTSLGALISGATAKTTLVDADAIAIMDSAASNATKQTTFANIKTWIKNYTDTLYALSGGVIPDVPQTVLSGPVDSSGFAAFGGSTGSATLTTSGVIKATCFAGDGNHRIGTITNAAFTSPSGSGTGYMHLEIAADGTVTTGVSTSPWNYAYGSTPSTTNGQHTVNSQEGKVYVGNGTVANQVYRVCIGECPYTSSAWSGSPTWYAIKGKYDSGLFAVSASTTYSKSHNLGTPAYNVDVTIADDASGTNERPLITNWTGSSNGGCYGSTSSRNSTSVTTQGSVGLSTAGSGVSSAYYRLRVRRQ